MRKTFLTLFGLAVVLGLAALFGEPSHAATLDSRALGLMAFGGISVNAANIRALSVSFRDIYNSVNAATPNRDHYQRLATEIPSTARSNEYGWLGDNFKIREWIGDRVLQNLATHSFTIPNKPFEGTIAVDRDDIEDDNLGVYKPMIGQIGEGAAIHPNELVFDCLRQGETALCYDGQPFFDTDHLGWDDRGKEISVSNHMGGTGEPWFLLCTMRQLKPLIFQKRRNYQFAYMDSPTDEYVFTAKKFRYGVDARVNGGFALWQMAIMSRQPLTHDNYAAAKAAMTAIRKQNGQPAGFAADTLMVPSTLEGAARKILINETKPNGESNEWKGSAQLFNTVWLG
ncbi:MAG TPA: Mu-like prophage major head subunit gpT family protein [Azospirillum sp.]|nr:Mu-like prophage major head subunit gpT family protein [Azospirillum sp.]